MLLCLVGFIWAPISGRWRKLKGGKYQEYDTSSFGQQKNSMFLTNSALWVYRNEDLTKSLGNKLNKWLSLSLALTRKLVTSRAPRRLEISKVESTYGYFRYWVGRIMTGSIDALWVPEIIEYMRKIIEYMREISEHVSNTHKVMTHHLAESTKYHLGEAIWRLQVSCSVRKTLG